MFWKHLLSRPQRRRARRHPGKLPPRRRYYPALEVLEDRTLLSTFLVTNTGDNGGIDPAVGAGTGTLRQAIVDANANAGPDTIAFNIPTTDPGFVDVHSALAGGGAAAHAFVIKPLMNLPQLTDDGTIIDGRTQTAFTGDTNPFGPEIVLDGNPALTRPGLRVFSSGNEVTGICVEDFPTRGIQITGSHNWIFGTYVGTDPTGTLARGNGGLAGIIIQDGARSNLIGTNGDGVDDAAERNVVSGNLQDGIDISGTGTDYNVVAGNYIGTDATGTAALGNGDGTNGGIHIILGASFNLIGTNSDGIADAAERNVISGNLGRGVEIKNLGTTGNIVAGNFIGTDASGKVALGNTAEGVAIDFFNSGSSGATDNRIGTNGDGVNDDTERNVISGNGGAGVGIGGAGTDRNVVAGNYIGVDVTGMAALGNGLNGLTIAAGGQNNRIGTNGDGVADAAERNVISGNNGDGVLISDAGTDHNVVAGNYIGTNAAGTGTLGNRGVGVYIAGGASNNTIGGTVAGAGNVISGNGQSSNYTGGIYIASIGTTGNVVEGNLIGTDKTGTVALGNHWTDVGIFSGATGNIIGGSVAGAGNVISASAAVGVEIHDAGTSNNVVAGNFIGTDKSGTFSLGNTFAGIQVWNGATDNTIGGTTVGAGNVISGNAQNGVLILGSGTNNNTVAGNFIGTDSTGTTPLGNGVDGVFIGSGGAQNNTIGGTTAAARNVISGNGSNGVEINGSGATGNVVEGNYIGTNAAGTAALGNLHNGVYIEASGNTIGGSSSVDPNTGNLSGAGNLISGNLRSGVQIASGTNNLIQGNFIGTDVTGEVALGNDPTGVYDGIDVLGGSSNMIGGANSVDANGNLSGLGNLISGNNGASNGVISFGVYIVTSSNIVQGNFIGTDVTGTNALSNAGDGVALEGAGNLVGGASPEFRNVISGDGANGVEMFSANATENVVEGNYIGTNAAGTAAVGNSRYGVIMDSGAHDNTIGGTTAGMRNVISGNARHGVRITGSGTKQNMVSGNYIGTDATGKTALGNLGDGVLIENGAQSNIIGTNGDGVNDAAERNVISGNGGNGVEIVGTGVDNNVVAGNYIGTDVTGTVDLGNRVDGVAIWQGAQSNRVGTNGDGTADAAERNIISGNGRHGVDILNAGTDNNVVAGNYIGTDVTGTVAVGNGNYGVLIYAGAQRNRIGTNGDGVADAAERNVISGNTLNGVEINDAGTDYNVVAGNYIGTDVTGTAALGNRLRGVRVTNGAQSNRIGTNGDGVADAAERNVISGNNFSGVEIRDAGTDHNIVAGNYIGTDATGTAPLGNAYTGVDIFGGARYNVVGTDGSNDAFNANERNIIAANGGGGVGIGDAGTNYNVVAGNYIGTDVTGSVALGNGPGTTVNVALYGGAQFNRIGTDGNGIADSEERNVISGHVGWGVNIQGTGTDYNLIAGNFIGTDATGTVAVPNESGVVIGGGGNGAGGSQFNQVQGNIISGNSRDGVRIVNVGTDYNVVAGNYIGADVTGTVAVGNGRFGIWIYAGAQGNLIGTNGDGVNDAAERNVISANGSTGVYLTDAGTTDNRVQGNYIGTDVTGSVGLGNGYDGVGVVNASGNWIGTNGDGTGDANEGNVVSDNQNNNIGLFAASNNVIAGNLIGTDATGTHALGARYSGVWIGGGSQSNRVGTNGDGIADAAERNVISANNQYGVLITDAGTDHTVVAGNYIGTDVSGAAALGNGGDGVLIQNGAQSNVIGTNGDGVNDAAEGNTIAFNSGAGIVVRDAGSTDNSLRGNSIHSNGGLGIDLGGDGVTLNDSAGHVGPNNLQNFPVLSLAESGTTTHVVGTLNSTPNTTFILDFYASDTADPSGHGEAKTWLGFITVTTDAAGNALFDTSSLGPTTAGQFLTATATDPDGNTSEFALNALVMQPTAGSTDTLLSNTVTNYATSGIITQDEASALNDSLVAAQNSIANGNTTAASGQIGAFVNKIDALILSGSLDQDDANVLLEMAYLLLAQLDE